MYDIVLCPSTVWWWCCVLRSRGFSSDPLEQVMRERARGRGEGGTRVRQQNLSLPPLSLLSLSARFLQVSVLMSGRTGGPRIVHCVVAQLYREWCGVVWWCSSGVAGLVAPHCGQPPPSPGRPPASSEGRAARQTTHSWGPVLPSTTVRE